MPAAQGSFETALGQFVASWSNSTVGFQVNVTAPEGTSGVVILPVKGVGSVDGEQTEVPAGGLMLEGGSHTITVTASWTSMMAYGS
jgi:hypothetical protein